MTAEDPKRQQHSNTSGRPPRGGRPEAISKEVSMMARTDVHLDAMLRHLGAAYYESLHGRATRSDVNRALDTVEEHLHEQATARPARPVPVHHDDGIRHRRWARRVSDVMTTAVVTVDRITPYQDIDRLLTERRISGVPVLMMGRKVAGVVTEADLLAAEDESARRSRMAGSLGRRWRLRKRPHVSLTAETLMTAPALTIGPDATIPAAARLMNTHHVRRLPVVDEDGKLVGIVSRRDLLSVFLRPDADIVHDARQVIDEIALADAKDLIVTVKHGVVTLAGTLRSEPGQEHDLVPLALQLIWDIDGVVDVVNRLGETKVAETA
jgi:CBS domain-containing protein